MGNGIQIFVIAGRVPATRSARTSDRGRYGWPGHAFLSRPNRRHGRACPGHDDDFDAGPPCVSAEEVKPAMTN